MYNVYILGIVWWFHEDTKDDKPWEATRHVTQDTQNCVTGFDMSIRSRATKSFKIAFNG